MRLLIIIFNIIFLRTKIKKDKIYLVETKKARICCITRL